MTKSFLRRINFRSEEVLRFCAIAVICTFLSIAAFVVFQNPYYTLMLWAIFFLGLLDANFCLDYNQRKSFDILDHRLDFINKNIKDNIQIKVSKLTSKIKVVNVKSDQLAYVNQFLCNDLHNYGLVATNFSPTSNPTVFLLEMYWKLDNSVVFVNK